MIHCLSITPYRRTGIFKQEIIWKSWEKQNIGENSRSSVNFQIMKLCILNVWNVVKPLSFFFSLKFIFLEFYNNFVPDLENLHYVLHLNTSDRKAVLEILNQSKTIQKFMQKCMLGDWKWNFKSKEF